MELQEHFSELGIYGRWQKITHLYFWGSCFLIRTTEEIAYNPISSVRTSTMTVPIPLLDTAKKICNQHIEQQHAYASMSKSNIIIGVNNLNESLQLTAWNAILHSYLYSSDLKANVELHHSTILPVYISCTRLVLLEAWIWRLALFWEVARSLTSQRSKTTVIGGMLPATRSDAKISYVSIIKSEALV